MNGVKTGAFSPRQTGQDFENDVSNHSSKSSRSLTRAVDRDDRDAGSSLSSSHSSTASLDSGEGASDATSTNDSDVNWPTCKTSDTSASAGVTRLATSPPGEVNLSSSLPACFTASLPPPLARSRVLHTVFGRYRDVSHAVHTGVSLSMPYTLTCTVLASVCHDACLAAHVCCSAYAL